MEHGCYVSIPVSVAPDPEQLRRLLEERAIVEVSERFLESENIRANAGTRRQVASFFSKTFDKPQAFVKQTREGEFEMQIQYRESEVQRKNSQKILKLKEQQDLLNAHIRLAKSQANQSLMKQAYDFAKPDLRPLPKIKFAEERALEQQKANEHMPFVPESLQKTVFPSETNYDANYEESKSDGYYEQHQVEQQQLEQKQQQFLQQSVLDPDTVDLNLVFVQDFAIMQELQKLLHENSDDSGPLWCIGGLSFYEIVHRFIYSDAAKVTSDQPPDIGKTNYPFNPRRRDVLFLAKAVLKRKTELVNKLMDKYLLYQFPLVLDEVFPQPLFQLLQVMKIDENYVCHKNFKVQVLITPENTQIKQIIDKMRDELQQILDAEFGGEVAEIITDVVRLKFVDETTQTSKYIIEFYNKFIKPRPPTILNDPECKKIVSCHMDERQGHQIENEDVVRYLEGFVASVDFQKMFRQCNIDLQDISWISQKIISNECVQFSKILALIFKSSYLEPLNQICQSNKDEILANSIRTNISLRDQTLSQLKATGKAMTYSQISATKYQYFWQFQQKLEQQQLLIMGSEGARDLVRQLNQSYNELFYTDQVADIATHAGSEALVQYINENLAATGKTISPLRFRKMRSDFMRVMSPMRKNASEEDLKARKQIEDFIQAFDQPLEDIKKKMEIDFDLLSSHKTAQIKADQPRRALSPMKQRPRPNEKQYARPAPKPVFPSHIPFVQKLERQNPFLMADNTSEQQSRHLRLHMPILMLACRVAAVKVVEEEFPFLIHSHIGRVLEQKCFKNILNDLPGSLIFDKSIKDLVQPDCV